LEIRGAGHLFGNEQSGHIADVGLELYLEMLEGAVRRLEGKPERDEAEPDISASLPAFIPDDYISNDGERLLVYKRISAVASNKEIKALKNELMDRFGKSPQELSNLLELMELKIHMKALGIEKADIGKKKAVLIISEQSELYKSFPPEGRMELYHEDKASIGDIKNILQYLTRKGKKPKE
jgi:transcription-repair coupling factor (superfamily II helicase)